VTRGNAQVSVAFSAPSDDGGAGITGYTVLQSTGGSYTTASTSPATCVASPCTVTALTNGTAYTFEVEATNGVGTGPASSPSASVTPATTPTVLAVNPNNGPVSGGTPITITGTGFIAGATVEIGQGNGLTGAIAATSVVVVSSTEITAVTGGGAKAGLFNLFVTTSGGTSAGNTGDSYTYH